MLTIDNEEDLLEYAKGDPKLEEHAKNIIEFNENPIARKMLNSLIEEEKERKEYMDYARKKGREDATIEIIQRMLDLDIDPEIISKVARIDRYTLEELKKLEEEEK